MSLFKRNKENTENTECCCNGNSCCCYGEKSIENTEIKNIKVLGAGCKSCKEQYQNVLDAVAEIGLDAEVEYVTDIEKVMQYGVMSMPAITVNDTVVAYGKVLKTKDVIKLLKG